MAFEFKIDPTLPLPLGAQLRGLIEYGIACGDLQPRARLPSVRSLAEQLGIAPMTVSQVFKDLQDAELIESRTGRGTYVRSNVAVPQIPRPDFTALRDRADALVADALDSGVPPAELSALLTTCLNRHARRSRSIRVAMVGAFEQSTREFVADLKARLRHDDDVAGLTIDGLQADAELRRRMAGFDLILTFTNRMAEVTDLLGSEAQVMGVSYIPSDATRIALAGLDARQKVGLVSTFDTFLPVMQSGVRRLAPQIGSITASVLGHSDLPGILSAVDVVIFATGADEVTLGLPGTVHAFEYRHALHPLELETNVLPEIERLRVGAKKPAAEPSKEPAE